jgi:sulfide:quinone oxidoreductase
MVDAHVVVLGAGTGGTIVANRLRRALSLRVRVTVVDRDPVTHYKPSFYLYPFGYADPTDHARDVRRYLRDGVRFRRTAVADIDPENRRVHLAGDDGGALDYDHLVVALGHDLHPERTPGMPAGPAPEANVYPFYRRDAAVALREAVERFDGGRAVVTTPDTSLSCGGAPLKFALLLEDYLDRRGRLDGAEVVLTRPTDALFGTSDVKAPYERALREHWRDRAITFRPDFTPDRVDTTAGVVHGEDGAGVSFDLLAPVTPQGPLDVLEDSALAGEDGYVAVDPHTLRHREYDAVHAVGDCTDVPTSKTGAAARKQAAVVADRLAASLSGERPTATYSGFTACPILTRRGHAILPLFDYERSLTPAVESRLAWVADVELLPRVYWSLWMQGLDPTWRLEGQVLRGLAD